MITHLKLITHKLPQLEEFYTKILGLPVSRISETQIVVSFGTTEIEFTQVAEFDPEAPPMYHFALNISENKLEQGMAWLAERDISLLPDSEDEVVFDFVNWNAHSVYFYDPGGNQLEFIARHELANAGDGDFSQKDILSVSEIGLVVEDVWGTKDMLGEKFGLQPYRPSSTTFAAVGDANGLFIVVPPNRIWLASDVRSHIFPTEVWIAGDREGEHVFEGLPYRVIAGSLPTPNAVPPLDWL